MPGCQKFANKLLAIGWLTARFFSPFFGRKFVQFDLVCVLVFAGRLESVIYFDVRILLS